MVVAARGATCTVVGGGPVGLLIAIGLSRRGIGVTLCASKASAGREEEVVLLTRRSLRAFAQHDLARAVLEQAVALRRMSIHSVMGEREPLALGRGEAIWSIRRRDLQAALRRRLEADGPNLIRPTILDAAVVTAVDVEAGRVDLIDADGAARTISSDLVIGADGASSVVREAVMRGAGGVGCARRRFDLGARRFVFTGGPSGFDEHALHVWPRDGSAMVALPRREGGFVCQLTAPLGVLAELEACDEHGLRRFFQMHFPDVVPFAPDLVERFSASRLEVISTIRLAPPARGKVALLGTAGQQVAPGIGVTSSVAFDSCLLFERLIDRFDGDLGKVAEVYGKLRVEEDEAAQAVADDWFDELIHQWGRDGGRVALRLRRMGLLAERVAAPRFELASSRILFGVEDFATIQRRSRAQIRAMLILTAAAILLILAVLTGLLLLLL